MARSWVTMTSVCPAWCTSCSRSSTAAAVWLSRLPVGSSAHTIAGSATSARAIGDALLLAAGQLGRPVRGAVAEPDPVEHGVGAVPCLLAAACR